MPLLDALPSGHPPFGDSVWSRATSGCQSSLLFTKVYRQTRQKNVLGQQLITEAHSISFGVLAIRASLYMSILGKGRGKVSPNT
jgi:hypothetical protein